VALRQDHESSGHHFLFLELCLGGDLWCKLDELERFSESLSRHIAAQVAEAIRYLHEDKGMVHWFVVESPGSTPGH